ncbi:hypothetical protein F441_12850 [Phytophthora nicotianae CJ01A1]|uniref:Uncharacterized protein n=4 Tax=Phytophthora nicotianae TaxID=4792 RepID=W2R567_PHYN3|nr:hypothetical protein PPTG_02980 [Phytophthora nicotianae INRA-310]ETI41918.1 hypothetical protein F443_12883 [Phytophthora nicotianae P1569]ETK81949.1 hypothetical protein L915_12591 [Phytophthora nicotianae]ETP11668.1 hypothetical protein F441_12850 [Phytophthora nicotianae CJ01A1]KUF93088.1 hypothetical protein AM587_10007682 [Phytophthora nicotianae]ETL35355.1 hypothetical protein L916_12500 [Phytophthora nicotianae]
MRFRFGEGEEQLFATDILPLLDVDNEDESCTSSTCGDSSADSSTVDTCTAKLKAGEMLPAPRSRLRLRSKIERLRREIQTLGVELADLQRPGRGLAATAVKRTHISRWQFIAAKNKQQRERAEHDNKVLKRMIAAQNILAKSILNGRFRLSSKVRCTVSTSSRRRYPRINV